MSGRLYVVGTPIGNLSDMSARGLETLRAADFIAAEDTRVTRGLLTHFEIHKPLISYHEYSPGQREELIISRILAGENCALVSDAGMPAISDPGEELVRACREKSIPVEAVPGPSAVITALAVSGMPCGRFSFEGFLSTNKKNRKEHLEEIKRQQQTLVFYEAPHKLSRTLADLYEALGERKIAVVRELTKIYEQVLIMNLSEAVLKYADEKPKGELVLIVEGSKSVKTDYDLREAVELARAMMGENRPISEAARLAAHETGIEKREIYKMLLNNVE